MKEPEIVVLSGDNRQDQYGNFLFKDLAGAEHKIGAKRENQSELVALINNNPGRGVKLTYNEYMNRSFIVGAELVEGALPEPVKTETQPIPQIDTPPSKSREDAIREGMWFKELGESLRSGLIDRSTPAGKLLEKFYKAEMQSALHFKIEKGE